MGMHCPWMARVNWPLHFLGEPRRRSSNCLSLWPQRSSIEVPTKSKTSKLNLLSLNLNECLSPIQTTYLKSTFNIWRFTRSNRRMIAGSFPTCLAVFSICLATQTTHDLPETVWLVVGTLMSEFACLFIGIKSKNPVVRLVSKHPFAEFVYDIQRITLPRHSRIGLLCRQSTFSD